MKYCQQLKTCTAYLKLVRVSIKQIILTSAYRIPPVKYPRKMAQKSKCMFVCMKNEDPASNSGIISIYKVYMVLYFVVKF